ncbi:hypothetical protein EPA93_34280 [Ktedonosporobacter rubrisoli]|uniref:DUF998 domain-containing protein n=1 Tax=Ktedonosporobacter rubrisoli TaxID=2509675 RepID=A0A4P6K046_KTERU|nr:hypothetical protein [Ktedonosporobacter rubrisoli]QBD80766.1 hypothetical protein EPA93_34280 [Ktedonosporobacter rubrisoli]
MPSSLFLVWRRVAPILALLILAPFVAEVLEGSTHLTNFFVFPSEVGVYGCAALLIRAFVRAKRKGWAVLLLLAIAYGIAEECVILQTSLVPLLAAKHIYGRLLDVNWIYLLWAVGYESVWSIILPIQLAELLFPERRDDPWLGKTGLIITAIVFLLASIGTWFMWMHALTIYAPGLHYQPPLFTITAALIVIAILVASALALPASSRTAQTRTRRAPHSWLVGIVAFVSGLLWFAPLLLHYGLFPAFPFALALVLILALAVGTLWLIWYWSAAQDWGDRQRLALIFGALLACMLAGFPFSGIVLTIDFIWKGVCDLLALLALAYLAWKIRRRVNIQEQEA